MGEGRGERGEGLPSPPQGLGSLVSFGSIIHTGGLLASHPRREHLPLRVVL